jgi:glutathione peroxidase
VTTASGINVELSDFAGSVLLIVNTASRCVFTPQYAGLVKLYQDFSSSGFSVLAFPCNQFGRQEPDRAEKIQRFCSVEYGVCFPIFEKVKVNGVNAHPLYKFMKNSAPGILDTQSIKWNFTKFLIDRNGRVVRRYSPFTNPERLRPDIQALLNKIENH